MLGCTSCQYRHGGCPVKDEDMETVEKSEKLCKKYKDGKCFTCKHFIALETNRANQDWYFDVLQNAWFSRGCETEFPCGCDLYKRDWKATWISFSSRFQKPKKV